MKFLIALCSATALLVSAVPHVHRTDEYCKFGCWYKGEKSRGRSAKINLFGETNATKKIIVKKRCEPSKKRDGLPSLFLGYNFKIIF